MNSQPPAIQKGLLLTYVIWFLGGWCLGLHKFYLGKVGWGIVYILTGGLLLIGWVIDAFAIPAQVRNYNQGLKSGALFD